MIRRTMAVAAVTASLQKRAIYARAARWDRARALLIDLILWGLISFVVNSVYGVTHIETFPSITVGAGTYTTSVSVPVQALLALLYFAVPEAMFGATPGKWWVRLKVVRLDGRPLRLRDVVLRNVLRVVDSAPAFYILGGLLVGLSPGSQRLGDLAAGTTVVGEQWAREPGATRASGPRARRALVIGLAAAVVLTIAFEYFGRPPLVIEGDYNRHVLIGQLDSYTLGKPSWRPGEVTYPISGRAGNQACTGYVDLTWEFMGWTESGASLDCVPS